MAWVFSPEVREATEHVGWQFLIFRGLGNYSEQWKNAIVELNTTNVTLLEARIEPLLPRDPVDDSTYQPGAAVTLVGLTTASLNGETGWVAQALDEATGRIAVRLKPLSTVKMVLVKPSNLERDWDPHRDRREW